MFAGAGLGEEGGEAVVGRLAGVGHGQLAVGLDAVLHAVKLPAGIAHLDSGLRGTRVRFRGSWIS